MKSAILTSMILNWKIWANLEIIIWHSNQSKEARVWGREVRLNNLNEQLYQAILRF